jgi:hypothetical protein
MRRSLRALAALIMGTAMVVSVSHRATSLTVEKISLQKLTDDAALIVHGRVLSSFSQWEDGNIYTYTAVKVSQTLKGPADGTITVKHMGGRVGDIAEEIPGAPTLLRGEEVVLFLVYWKENYWVHSIVLGKFSVVEEQGMKMAVNDLNNVGLIDPTNGREVTDAEQKVNAFPLGAFLSRVQTMSGR